MFETILAHIYKQYLKTSKSPADLGWVFIYPLIGLLSLGIFGLYFKFEGASLNPLIFIVVGVVAWNIYAVSQKAITYGLTYDIWDECLRHTYLGKSTDEDFVIGNSIYGLVTALASLLIVAVVAQILFGLNILNAGMYLLGGVFAVFLYAVSEGLIINSLVLRRGYDWTSLIWMSTGIVMILSGVYYPVEFLPLPFRFISWLIPATHSIISIRASLGVSAADAGLEMFYALLLSSIYLVISFIIYKRSVRKAREKGSLLWF